MISIKHTLNTASRALLANKVRSSLTILGVVIGVAAIIIILSLGQAASSLILSQVQGLGANLLTIVPGEETEGANPVASLFIDSLKQRELDAIRNKNNVPTLLDATPDVLVTGSVIFEGESYQGQIFGSGELFADILDVIPEEGRYYTRDEVDGNAKVAVIGSKVKDELFGVSGAVGQNIKIRGDSFRVVGVFPREGSVSLFGIDDSVVVPYTTAQRYLGANDFFAEVLVRAQSEEDVPRTVRDITATLRELHDLEPGEANDFTIQTQDDLVEIIGTVTTILTALLAAVAAISLIVGGIGIMNIMYVSVRERTREIGLRKALGATEGDITKQFLLEAIVLTFFGGILGMAVGIFVTFVAALLINRFTDILWPFVIPVSAIILGVGVSVFIGVTFGYYPARNAARKNPIEALRYE